MRLIYKHDMIANIALRWKTQYYSKRGWENGGLLDKESIYNALSDLPADVDESAITNIIGNDGWTRNNCEQCRTDCDVLVEVGQPSDYDSRTASLCKRCIRSALEAFDGPQ